MKVIKKNVYYCDHCKKRTLSSGSMKVHETHCTANPNRICRMCGGGVFIGNVVNEFKKRFKLVTVQAYEDIFEITDLKAEWTGKPVTLDEIRDSVDDCPNCILSVLRQCKFNYHYFNGMGIDKFNYKKELQEALSEKNGEPDYYL